ncbi:MAG: hypothetical protein ACOZQL_36715 [Myxococcota bacterium]
MRWLALVVVLAGCPLPEDTFVLTGTLVARDGSPLADQEVRLLRNRTASELRCDALSPLRVTKSDADGRFEFRLIRQEITAGVLARRFFAVEFTNEYDNVLSKRFWFPDGDFDVGEVGRFEPTWTTSEALVEGHVAWRRAAEPFFTDQPLDVRVVETRRDWVTVPIDSLGRTDTVPVESRVDWPPSRVAANDSAPPSRGARCANVDVHPCPLTDGRYLPFEFASPRPALVLDFDTPIAVSSVTFHGLVLSAAAASARFELAIVRDSEEWIPMQPARLDGRLQQRSGEMCEEPGQFFVARTVGLADALRLRITFVDGEDKLVPVVALQEVAVQ